MSERFREFLTESKIGKTILTQIKAIDKFALTSWGAKDFVTTEKGVQFDVRGSKHRGKVIIALDKGKDLYNIEIGTIRNAEWNSKKTVKRIQVANLVKTIDNLVG